MLYDLFSVAAISMIYCFAMPKHIRHIVGCSADFKDRRRLYKRSASEKSIPENVKRLSEKLLATPCTSTEPCSGEMET